MIHLIRIRVGTLSNKGSVEMATQMTVYIVIQSQQWCRLDVAGEEKKVMVMITQTCIVFRIHFIIHPIYRLRLDWIGGCDYDHAVASFGGEDG